MSFLKGYNYFTLGERRGLVVLIAILAIVVVYIFSYKSFAPSHALSKDTYAELESHFEMSQTGVNFKKNNQGYKNTKKEALRFEFDPNTVNLTQLISMGLSQKQASSILNYRNKGGQFRTKSDFKKMYTVSQKFFDSVEPYIVISQKTQSEKRNYNKPYTNKTAVSKPKVTIDLQTANAEILQSVKGIGEKTANRIIKYRTLLGGFHSINQLKEVYGVSPENLERILPQVFVSVTSLKKININKVEGKALKTHPYIISWDQVNEILNERKLGGHYTDFEDLKKRSNLDGEVLEKIKPYLVYNGSINA